MQNLNFFPPSLYSFAPIGQFYPTVTKEIPHEKLACVHFRRDSSFSSLKGKVLMSTFTPRTSESIDMSILNALGLGKCLDTSLDRQLSQKAKKLLKAH